MSSSDLPETHALKAEGAFAAWALRVESGEALDFDEVLRAHPALAGELRRLYEDWKLFAPILGKVVPGLIASESGLVIPSLSGGPDIDDDAPSPALLERLGIHTPNEGRYRFRAVLGRGGGGVVLKVWDTKLNRPLAMKVVLGRGEDRPSGQTPKVDGRTLSRFVDEARIASQLNHPGIVPVHELGADETGRAFFTMKLVRGEDLTRVFEHVRDGTEGWSLLRALNVLLRVCEAMAYAHDKGVIHRDLKPANVMVGAYGEVHVMDWGLARAIGATESRADSKPKLPVSVVDSIRGADRVQTPNSPLLTVAGAVVGTPSYMSPEQARGELKTLGPATDVYAIGAMLYELLGGEPPYVPRGARVAAQTILMAVMHASPKAIEELAPRAPAELIAICDKSMSRNVAVRYATMKALAEDLRAFVDGRVVSAFETGTWAETRKWVQRNKALAAALVATLMVAVLGTLAFAVKAGEATRNEGDARRAQRDAEDRTKEARWNGYVAALTGADAARRVGEPVTLRRLLDSAPKELRRWEWGYLDAMSDTSLLVLEGQAAAFRLDGSRVVTLATDAWLASPACIALSPDGSRIVTAPWDKTARVWDAASGTLLASLEGQAGVIRSVAFSPDGSRIVTGSYDKTARVWDAASGVQVASLDGHALMVTSAAYCPDGLRIVTASSDNTARVWDSSSGVQLACMVGHTGEVNSAMFSPDGSRIVTASWDKTARVWDSTSGAQLASLEGHSSTVEFAAFSPDGLRIVTTSWDGTTRLWDSASCAQLAVLEGHTGGATAAFSSDGSRIVTASSDGTARVWDSTSSAQLTVLRGHTGGVTSAAFSPDGSRVVTASSDNTVRVWDVASGAQLALLEGHTSDVLSVAFSLDGSHIFTASADHTTRVWDAALRARGSHGQESLHWVNSAAFSPDGSRIVTTSEEEGTSAVWDTASGEQFTVLEGHRKDVFSASFSFDGSRIVTASADNTARVWDVISGAQLTVLEGHTQYVFSASFSRDGSRIVTGSWDKTARVWDTASGARLLLLGGHTDEVIFATFSPDGSRVLTASRDKTARVWDATSGAQLVVLEGHLDAVRSAAFSSDGSRVVTASNDRTARVWDTATGAQLVLLEGHTAEVNTAAFSPDGSRVVTASDDRTARVWDATSGEQRALLDGHTDKVRSAAFSPDGSRIVTAGDATARVWDAISGMNLVRLEGHKGGAYSATFSPDGARIVLASPGDGVYLWDSVPNRVRYSERRALLAARPDGKRALEAVIPRARGFVEASTALRRDPSLDPMVRQASLDALSERCRAAQPRAKELGIKSGEHLWLSRLLGREAWPSEREVEAAIDADPETPSDSGILNGRAWDLVDPNKPPLYGSEVRALVFARRAVAAALFEKSNPAPSRDTLARALYRNCLFDEALEEQRGALAEAALDKKKEYETYLQRLSSDIAKWRDEAGHLRRAELTERLEVLNREIATLERDADVRLWLGRDYR